MNRKLSFTKTIFLSAIISALFISTSCKKTLTAPEMRQQAAEKLMGKWMLDKQVNEVYAQLTNLSSMVEYKGTGNDYYNFKTSDIVEVNSLQTGKTENIYEVIKPYQVLVGDIGWRIEKLTTEELHLVLDRNNAAEYKRYVTKMYFKR